MSVLLVETNGRGHRFRYVRHLVNEALHRGWDVTLLTTPQAVNHAEFKTHLDGESPLLVVAPTRYFHYRMARCVWRASRVVIPDGDKHLVLALIISLVTRARVAVVVLRMNRAPGPVGFLKDWLKRTLIRVLNHGKRAQALTLSSALEPSLTAYSIRDPMEFNPTLDNAQDARRAFGLAEDAYWFGVLGALSERKNVVLAIKALSRASHLTEQSIGLFLAGEATTDSYRVEILRAIGEATTASLVWCDEVLSEGMFDSALLAIDCAVLAHSNEGASGILGKAVLARKRVLAAGASSLKRDVHCIADIATWVPLGEDTLAGAMASEPFDQGAHLTADTQPMLVSAPSEFAARLLD